jgi:AraC-like DNA-binding protein
MSSQTILWVDLRTSRAEPDLCTSLPPIYRTERLHHLGDLFQAVQNWRPWAMCFEYDAPDARNLAAPLEVKARHPSLPIIMLTERCIGKREILALRHCVWEHLVKPVSVGRFCECLTGLNQAADKERKDAAACLAPAMSYVAANYSEKLRLSTAAKLCDLSRFQFSRNFKKEQGLTFRDFVVQMRIQRAAELMRQANALSVTEAAFVVGFNDLSYFSRMFRRQLGVTPSHYRRAESQPAQLPLFTFGETRKP